MHLLEVDHDPPQPGLLQDVLGVGGRAEHLGYDKHQRGAGETGGSRNGARSKTVLRIRCILLDQELHQ
ncbi:hypothetical protein AB0K12_37750 [Nonomuraea sp. NPDC049419]|uniref:hypothetical protein n=1 Tax=Nonomuraea sp. NPDC049419 TaxID=3155772 RepID=UPI00343F4D05